MHIPKAALIAFLRIYASDTVFPACAAAPKAIGQSSPAREEVRKTRILPEAVDSAPPRL